MGKTTHANMLLYKNFRAAVKPNFQLFKLFSQCSLSHKSYTLIKKSLNIK